MCQSLEKGWLLVASERRKILLVSSEAAPYAKSGGLGDVVGSLPKALKEADVDVRVVLPKYATIKEEHMQDVEYVGSFLINLAWRTQEAKILRKNSGTFPVYFIVMGTTTSVLHFSVKQYCICCQR